MGFLQRNSSLKRQLGIGIFEMAMMLLVLGMTSVVAVALYDRYHEFERAEENKERIERVQAALQSFVDQNGRLPGPAPMDAAPDTGNYGSEASVTTAVTAANSMATVPGTQVTNTGRDPDGGGPLANRVVRIGTIPVRSLNLADEYMLDAWGNRMVYAVTQDYILPPPAAPAVSAFAQDFGGISIRDSGNNTSTATDGVAIYALIAPGADKRGTFSASGVASEACAGPAFVQDNCFQGGMDATFVNTQSFKGDASTATGFAHSLKFKAGKDKYKWVRVDQPPCSTVCGPGTIPFVWQCQNVSGTVDPTGLRCLTPNPGPGTTPCNLGACTWFCDMGSCTSSCTQTCTPECRAPDGTPAPGLCAPPVYPGPVSQPCAGGACCTCGPPVGTCGETYPDSCGNADACTSPVAPVCGPPTGTCGGTYADSCGNAGACNNPNIPVCGPPAGSCGGTYADSCGNAGACNNPNNPVCGAAPAVCPPGTNYNDSCGGNTCACPACVPVCGPPTGLCGGTYADSCGNPNGCTNPVTPVCGAAPAGCFAPATYNDSCGNNVCACPPAGCVPVCGPPTGTCGGTYNDSCGAPTCNNPNTPVCGAAPAGCVAPATYNDSCGNNTCVCPPPPVCAPGVFRNFINIGETYPDMAEAPISGAELTSVGIQPGNFDVTAGDEVTITYNGGTTFMDTPPRPTLSYIFLYTVNGATGEITIVNTPLRAEPASVGTSVTYVVEQGVAKIGMFLFRDSISLLPVYSGRVDHYYRYGKTTQREARLIDPANDLMFVYQPPAGAAIVAPQAVSTVERGSPFNVNRNNLQVVVSAPAPGDPTTLRVSFEDFPGGPGYVGSDLDVNDAQVSVRIRNRFAPIDATCPLYHWQKGPLSACGAACGSSGPQNRAVACIRDYDGAVVGDGNCNPNTRPKTTETCTANPCGCSPVPGCLDYGDYQWEQWDWAGGIITGNPADLIQVYSYRDPAFVGCCDCGGSCHVNGIGRNCGITSNYDDAYDNDVFHHCGY